MSNQQKKQHQQQNPQQPQAPQSRVPNPATRVPPAADPLVAPKPMEPEEKGKLPVVDMRAYNLSGWACPYQKCGSKARKAYKGGEPGDDGTMYKYGCKACCRRFCVWAPAVVNRKTASKASSEQGENPNAAA